VNGSALRSIRTLERAAAARLAAAYVQLASLQSQTRKILARSSAARRAIHASSTWSAFECTLLANHLHRNAAVVSDLLARRCVMLERGNKLAREKVRWAKARVALQRRVTRGGPLNRA
jgi:hypothetical protein